MRGDASDTAVVSLSLIDSVVSIASWSRQDEIDGENALSGISVLRIVRVARVARLARVIRLMSFFRELRLMIMSILGCLRSLLWVTMILLGTFYMFSITFMSGIVNNLDTRELWSDPSTEGLRANFGSMDKSLLTLYMAMSGGRNWGEVYQDLQPIPFQYRAMFLIFLSFTIFAVLNIVTGVFVDSAMQANQICRQVIVVEEMDAKKKQLEELKELFLEMDGNQDGLITEQEFNEQLNDERVLAYFKFLNLDITDTQTLFHLLDSNESREIDVIEFLKGCYELQGEARSIDAKIMRMQLQWLIDRFDHMDDRLQSVCGKQK